MKPFLRLTLRVKQIGIILLLLPLAGGSVLWRRSILSGLTNPVAVPGQQFVYVSNIESNAISQYRMNSDGTLTPLEPPTVEDTRGPGGAFVVQKGFVFVLDNTEGATLSRYRIGADGTLRPLPPIVFSPQVEAEAEADTGQAIATEGVPPATVQGEAPPTLVGLAIPEDGRWLYAAKSDGSACQYDVMAGGDLRLVSRTQVMDPPPSNDWGTFALAVDTKKHWLYFCDNSTMGQMRLGPDGSPTGPLIIARGGPHSRSGAVRYENIALTPRSGGLWVDRFDGAGFYAPLWLRLKPNGLLLSIPNIEFHTFPKGLGPTAVGLTGRDVYIPGTSTSGRRENVVTHYRMRPDGGLVPASETEIEAGLDPIGLAFDATGRFAYVLDRRIDQSVGRPKDTGRVWQYHCNADGSLTALSPAFVQAGKVPISITVARL